MEISSRTYYVMGKYDRVARRYFYQCRECWFRQVKGALSRYAREREKVLSDMDLTECQEESGQRLMESEVRKAIRSQGLRYDEVKRLTGVNNDLVSRAAELELGIER